MSPRKTEGAETCLLDDFANGGNPSAIGTQWEGFTDRVMGGLSQMHCGVVDTDRGPALQMRGQVRLDNGGGFIQVRLPLSASGEAIDGSAWSAVAVEARGEPGAYYLHARTADTRRPWQHYRAPLPVEEDWQRVVVPFAHFVPQGLDAPLDRSRLLTVAVVAYGQAFEALLEVQRLELTTECEQ